VRYRRNITAFLGILLFCFSVMGQSESELKSTADDLFKQEKFIEATQYYVRLLSLNPRDHNYNYRYGTCLLFNSYKKKDAFKYLNFAISSPDIETEAFFYLGKAYHLTYQFNDAIRNYELYKDKAGTRVSKSLDVDHEIEMCQNGKRLLTTLTEMVVFEKNEIDREKFFRIYDLSAIGGNLLVTTDFQSKLDRKRDHIPLIHFPDNPSTIVYSSYGDDESTGKDIYIRRKLPNNTWGMEQKVEGGVNTKYDEDFPYLSPDQKYLYFSSKGHNSMGGFDVFRSQIIPETNNYGPAENMDFAISSPDDDVFFVVDSLNENGYFASSRQSQDGKLFVYKIRVDRVPIQFSVVKGHFNSTINPNNKLVFIDVTDYASGKSLGSFNSNAKGVYIVTFPRGGKYEYKIRVDGEKNEHLIVVEIPFLKEFKPLKQKMVEENFDGEEVIRVINLFDEEVDDPSSVIAEVIKLSSELNPNADQYDLKQLESEELSKRILSELGLANLSVIEVGYLLERKTAESQASMEQTLIIEQKLFYQVVKGAERIIELEKIINQYLAQASTESDFDKKYVLLRKTYGLIEEQAELNKLGKANMILSDSLSKLPVEKQKGMIAELNGISKKYTALLEADKDEEALTLLAGNQEKINELLNYKAEDPIEELVEKSVNLDEDLEKINDQIREFEQSVRQLENEVVNLERSRANAKSKDLENIESEITSKQTEQRMVQDEIFLLDKDFRRTKSERMFLGRQIMNLQEAYSSEGGNISNKADAAKALAAIKNMNSAQDLAQTKGLLDKLEGEHPELKDKKIDIAVNKTSTGNQTGKNQAQINTAYRVGATTTEPEDLARELLPNYKTRLKQLETDPALNSNIRPQLIANLNNQLTQKISKEIVESEKDLTENPTNVNLKNRIDGLKILQNELNSGNFLRGAVAIEKTEDKLIIANLPNARDEDLRNQNETLTNEYRRNAGSINANGTLSKADKIKLMQQEEAKLQSILNKELESVNQELVSNSRDSKLQERKKELLLIKDESKVRTVDNEQELLTESKVINEAVVENKEVLSPEKRRENVVKSVKPNYESAVAEINASQIDQLAKTDKLVNLEGELIAVLQEKRLNVQNKLKSDPSNTTLKSEDEDIESLLLKSKQRVNAMTQEVATRKESQVDETELIKAVDPAYTSEIAQLIESEKDSKFTELAVRESLYQDKIQAKIATNEMTIEGKTAAARVNESNFLKSELQESIKREENYRLEAEKNAVLAKKKQAVTKSPDQVLSSFVPAYKTEKSAIENNASLTKTDQLQQLIALEKKVLNTVQEERIKIEDEFISKPSDPILGDKVEDLKRTEASIESKLVENKRQLNALEITNEEPFVSKELDDKLKNIKSSFDDDLLRIQQNNFLSKEDKLIEVVKEEKKLIETLTSESEIIAEKLKNSPNDQALVLQNNQVLELKTSTENNLYEHETQLGVNVTKKEVSGSDSERLITELKPDHQKEIAEINRSVTDPVLKTSKLIEEEKTLLNSIVDAQSLVTNTLSADKNNSNLKAKAQTLESLKTETVKRIDVLNLDAETMQGDNINRLALIDRIDPVFVAEIKRTEASTNDTKYVALAQREGTLQRNLSEQITKNELANTQNISPVLIGETKVLNELLLASIEREKAYKTGNVNSLVYQSEEKIQVESVAGIMKDLDSNYESDKETLEANNQLSPKEKLIQLISIDQKMLDNLDVEIKKTENILENDPNNAATKSQLVKLNKTQAIVENTLRKNEEKLTKQEYIDDKSIADVDESEKLKTVVALHLEKMRKIQDDRSLSQTEIMNLLQKEDAQFLSFLENELGVNEGKTKLNPTNRTLIENKKELEDLITSTRTSINKRSEELASLGGSETKTVTEEANQASPSAKNNQAHNETVKNVFVAEIMPDYNQHVTEIKASNLDELTKTKQLLGEEANLLKALQKKENEVHVALNANPENQDTKAQQEVIQRVKLDIVKRVDALSELITAISNQTIDVVGAEKNVLSVREIEAGYQKNLKRIAADTGLSQEEKFSQIEKEEIKLLVMLEGELDTTEKQLHENPRDQKDETRKSELTQLKLVVEQNLTDHQNQLALLRDTKITESQAENTVTEDKRAKITDTNVGELVQTGVEKIQTSYQQILNTIAASSSLSQEGKLSQTEQEELKLVELLKQELEATEIELIGKPEDEKLLGRQSELAQLKVLIEQNLTDHQNQLALIREAKLEEERIKEKALVSEVEQKQDVIIGNENKMLTEKIEAAYLNNIAQISSDATLSKEDKWIQIEKEDIKSLALVDSEIESIEKRKLETPGDQNLKIRSAELAQLKLLIEQNLTEHANQLALQKGSAKTDKAIQEKEKQITIETIEDIERENILSTIKPSYNVNIATILNSNADSLTKTSQLLMEEKELYAALLAKENALQEGMKKVPTNSTYKEEAISVGNLKTKSTQRINELSTEIEILQKSEVSQTGGKYIEQKITRKEVVSIGELRTELLGNQIDELNVNYTYLVDLSKQQQIIENYQTQLNKRLSELDAQLKVDSENAIIKETKKNIENELNTVNSKLKSVLMSIGELETEIMKDQLASQALKKDVRYDDEKLIVLASQQELINRMLSDEITSTKERKLLEKELGELVTEEKKIENDLMVKEINEFEIDNHKKVEQLIQISNKSNISKVTIELAEVQNTKIQVQTNDYLEKASKIKDPVQKNYIFDKILLNQQQAADILQNALVENTISNIVGGQVETLHTKYELEQQRRTVSVQIGGLTSEIEQINTEISRVKSRNQKPLIEQRESLHIEQELLLSKLVNINHQLATFKEVQPTLLVNALEQPILYSEEVEIAQSEQYKVYIKEIEKTLGYETQITEKESELEVNKTETKDLITRTVIDPTTNIDDLIQQYLDKIRLLENEVAELKKQLGEQQKNLNSLTADQQEVMKMQNLIKRGVEPITKAILITSLAQISLTGLAIDVSSMGKAKNNTPIQINSPIPGGLVYRVQVGAFSKPIPEDMFKEFKPISAELLTNGIIRYMAGYFGSISKAGPAYKQIKELGYTDAFIVAYCNGERVSLNKAVQYERSGQCISVGPSLADFKSTGKKEESIINEKSIIEVTDSPVNGKVTLYNYNLAPGAAKAGTIESRKGLFFTVQIGVYNTPVSPEELNYIEPLYTKRLDNGQLRYSTGIYNYIEEARPKKMEAIEKGISDAFVTAYYNSERIALSEAFKLMEQNGKTILEPITNEDMKTSSSQVKKAKTPKVFVPVISMVEEVSFNSMDLLKMSTVNEMLNKGANEQLFVQVISKKQFVEYPRDVLNRFNNYGSYYYDTKDLHVKSVIYDSKEELPQLFYIRKEVDTLYVEKSQIINASSSAISFKVRNESLPGDVADWLLRLNKSKNYLKGEDYMIVFILDVQRDEIEGVMNQLKIFNLRGGLVSMKEAM
jgi:hypothetical protein